MPFLIMKGIVFYHLLLLALIVAGACSILYGLLPNWLEIVRVPITCALIGGLGGVTYCLRGVYLNACVRKQWDDAWQPWYYRFGVHPWLKTVPGLCRLP
jgi:uncharacterized MnhB-related membrane protein